MNYFDFKFLPVVLNDIINENAEEMLQAEIKREHQLHFQPTLDLIKSLEIRYDIDNNNVYTVYALDVPFPEECHIFGDNQFIYSTPIEECDFSNIDEYLMMNDGGDFSEEDEDSDELISMEDNDPLDSDWDMI